MGEYGQVLWLPVAAGLTLIGVVISIVRWRRRGAGSGLRGLAWALLPIGLYLIGVLNLLVPFAFKIVGWALGLVFNLSAWLGIVVLGLAVVLWVVSGVIIGRRQAGAGSGAGKDRAVGSGTPGRGAVTAGRTSGTATGASTAPLPATRTGAAGSGGSGAGASGQDDDMQDIEDILKRRGIT